MALKASNGLRTKILTTNSLAGLFNASGGGLIHIYAGSVPTTANDDVTGKTLLVTISSDGAGAGITVEAGATAGTLIKTAAETWSGTVIPAGPQVATFYRHVEYGDTGAYSETAVRLQGEIGTAGKEMNLANVSLSQGSVQTIDYYNIEFPTAV